MMNFKHTSQLAMLSVLLTFTHAIGQTAGAAGASSDLVLQDEEFVLESQRVKRQQRLAKYQEQKQKKQQEAKDSAQSVAPKQAAKSITFKGIRSNNVAKQKEQKRSKQERKVQVAEQANKQADAVAQENTKGQLSTVIRPSSQQSKSSSRWSLLSFLLRTPQQSKQSSKALDVDSVAKNTEQPAVVRVVNRIDINRYDGDSDKPVTLSTVMISKDAQEALHAGEQGATAALSGLSSMPVNGYDQVLVHAETERLVQKQARDSKALRISKLKDGLTLNKEKIARVKAERNAKQRGASRSSSQKKEEASAKSASAVSSQDSYKQAQDAGNSNVDAYVQASQYQCDSKATDWPCDECVVKRRANVGISICTMIVTVIAIIVGAIIISNASDTPDKGTAKP